MFAVSIVDSGLFGRGKHPGTTSMLGCGPGLGVLGGWVSPSQALGNPVIVFHFKVIFSATEGGQPQWECEEDPVDHAWVRRYVVSNEMIQAALVLQEECSVTNGK